jgi:hypothetical protein
LHHLFTILAISAIDSSESMSLNTTVNFLRRGQHQMVGIDHVLHMNSDASDSAEYRDRAFVDGMIG